MEFIFILIILILIYLMNSNKEEFVNNTFSHLVTLKDNINPFSDKIVSEPAPQVILKETIPLDLPEEIKNHYFMGRLKLNYYNENQPSAYLYGLPLESVHNLYSHVVFYDKEKKFSVLPPREKINHGQSFWVREKNHFSGPFVLV